MYTFSTWKIEKDYLIKLPLASMLTLVWPQKQIHVHIKSMMTAFKFLVL